MTSFSARANATTEVMLHSPPYRMADTTAGTGVGIG